MVKLLAVGALLVGGTSSPRAPCPAGSGGCAVADAVIVVALLLVAGAATAAVLDRDPVRQALVLPSSGCRLALLFTLLQAPDVALSQLAVGSAVTPLMILLTVRKVRGRAEGRGAAMSPRARLWLFRGGGRLRVLFAAACFSLPSFGGDHIRTGTGPCARPSPATPPTSSRPSTSTCAPSTPSAR